MSSYYHATLLATDKTRTHLAYLIEPITPTDENNQWAVVKIPRLKQRILQQALTSSNITNNGAHLYLEDYGSIILDGRGDPPEDVQEMTIRVMDGLPPTHEQIFL